jgi:hypothetical protein
VLEQTLFGETAMHRMQAARIGEAAMTMASSAVASIHKQ